MTAPTEKVGAEAAGEGAVVMRVQSSPGGLVRLTVLDAGVRVVQFDFRPEVAEAMCRSIAGVAAYVRQVDEAGDAHHVRVVEQLPPRGRR